MDDAQLREALRRARAGDAAAFGRVYRQFSQRVLGLCTRLLGSPAAGEDAASEVFERALRAIESYDLERPFEPWLLAIARRHCLHRLRGARGERQLFLSEPVDAPDASAGASPLAVLQSQEQRDALRCAIDGLPETYRVPLVLKYYEDLSYDAIAAELGVTRNHVGVLLHRAKRALRALMQEQQEEQT